MTKIIFFSLFYFILLISIPYSAAASCPILFQDIPMLETTDCSTETFVNALYQLSIALGAVIVVLRLIWAGTQYMLSDVVTKKENAKSEIRAALLGLLIILAAVTILNAINPQLTNLDFLRSARPVTSQGQEPSRLVTSVNSFVRGTKFEIVCNGNICETSPRALTEACEADNGNVQIMRPDQISTGKLTYYCF